MSDEIKHMVEDIELEELFDDGVEYARELNNGDDIPKTEDEREEINEYYRKYRQKHRDKYREYMRKYRQKHRDKYREYMRNFMRLYRQKKR